VFPDPGVIAFHGRFVGVLAPLSTGIQAFIDHHDWSSLLRTSEWPLDKIEIAYDRMRAINWEQYEAPTTTGRFYRYDPITGEVAGLPVRRWTDRDGWEHELSTQPVIFRYGMTIGLRSRSDYQDEAVRDHGEDSLRDNFGYDQSGRDTAHDYQIVTRITIHTQRITSL